MTSRELIEVEAANWLARLDASEFAVDVVAEFEAWRKADDQRHIAYRRLFIAWEDSAQLAQLKPFDGRIDADFLHPKTQRAGMRWASNDPSLRYGPRSFAVAFVVVLAIALIVWQSVPAALEPRPYGNPTEHPIRIPLQDGSTMELEAGAFARVRIERRTRSVQLENGKARFEVAHDARRPFNVNAAGARVRAIGTIFSVSLQGSASVVVRVTEGKVVVAAPNVDVDLDEIEVPPELPVIAAGFEGTVENDGVFIAPFEDPSSELTHRKEGPTLTFEGSPLAEAIVEFNKHNETQLAIGNPARSAMPIGGVFDATDLESFLTALENLGVRIERHDDGLILLQ